MKKSFLIVCVLLLFFPTLTLPASRICYEDFEGVTAGSGPSDGCIPAADPTGSGEIDYAGRPFHNDCTSCSGGEGSGCDTGKDGAFLSTGGNSGQCARAHVGSEYGGDSYSQPNWRFDNSIGGGDEIYIKFDFKIDSNLGTANENREIANFKFVQITSYADASFGCNSYWSPQINFEPSSNEYSWYIWSTGDCDSEYYFTRNTTRVANNMMDNEWHTYEIYISLGTHVAEDKTDADCDGIVRIWEDGVLILEDTAVPMRCSADEGNEINSASFCPHAKAFGAPVPGMDGYLYFDNIEVWDGMSGPTISDCILSGGEIH